MADMTFHLCCTQPQWTFGFWVFGFQCSVLCFPFFGKLSLPTCNSLRGSWLKVVGECHLSAQNYTLLKHIKSHLVGHPATPPHLLPTHTHIRSPQLLFGWRKTWYQAGTHTHAARALSFCGWHDSPVLLPLSLLSLSLFGHTTSLPRGGPFCMRTGFVYATIEFTASLNLCLSFRFRFRCSLSLGISWPRISGISPQPECKCVQCENRFAVQMKAKKLYPIGRKLLRQPFWLKQLAMSEQLRRRHLRDDFADGPTARRPGPTRPGCVLL